MHDENPERLNFTTWFLAILPVISLSLLIAGFVILHSQLDRQTKLERVIFFTGSGEALAIITTVAAVLSLWQKVGQRNYDYRAWTVLAAIFVLLVSAIFPAIQS